MQILLIIAVVVIAILLMWYSWAAAKKRRDALAALALRLGWSFSEESAGDFYGAYEQFDPFTRGHSRRVFNTLTGVLPIDTLPVDACMGDYEYKITTSDGKTTTTSTYRFSYLLFHLRYPQLPDLLIRPEGLFDKLKGALGFHDINFESAEFSRRFYVQSSDRKFAYEVIHPRMMEFLLASSRPVDLRAGVCCIADGSNKWEVNEFEPNLAWVSEFLRLWPRYLVKDLEERTPGISEANPSS